MITKRCNGCGETKNIQSFWSKLANRPASRCDSCRALDRIRYREQQFLKLTGISRFSNRRCLRCHSSALLGEVVCQEHIDDYIESAQNKDSDAIKVYEYAFNCMFCSWEKRVRYTKEKASLIRRAGAYKCPNCNGLLELLDDGGIVGKIYEEINSSRD